MGFSNIIEFSFLTGHCVFPTILITMMDVCIKSSVKKNTRIMLPHNWLTFIFFVVTDKQIFFIDMSKKINDFKS